MWEVEATLFLGGVLMHRVMYGILGIGNNGEVTTDPATAVPGEVKFTPEQQKVIDHAIETRLIRERQKYADYEDLKKFQQEQLAKQDKHAQEELEKSKKYEEAKKLYEGQINQHKDLVSKKDAEINDLKISHSLINEINKQNGYAEETLALIKSTAVLDANGNVTIKGRDANGIEVQLPVSEGIKKFLESRPYLVKSTHKAGAGSAGGTTTTTQTNENLNLNDLNAQYAEALSRRDYAKVKELTGKIRGQLQAKGVNLP